MTTIHDCLRAVAYVWACGVVLFTLIALLEAYFKQPRCALRASGWKHLKTIVSKGKP